VPAEQRLQRNGRLQRKPEKRYSARTVRVESEQAPEGAPDSEQYLSVHHRTIRWPRLSELQRSNPNGWVTWLAHRTVSGGAPDSVRWRTGLSGAPIDSSPTPTVGLVVGAINTPNHHHFKTSKFSAIDSIQEL
jgi:hypothetical protein